MQRALAADCLKKLYPGRLRLGPKSGLSAELLASPASTRAAAHTRGNQAWTAAAAGALAVGLGARLAIGGAGVGDRSAVVMATLLSIGVWLAARLLGGPKTAFLVTAGLLTLLDLAALPPRDAPIYDDLEAVYRTDQVLSARLAPATGALQSSTALTLLVQPIYAGAQPTFGLAGEIDGTTLSWRCQFEHGMQQLALPLPPPVLTNGTNALDVKLHLSGAPDRETDYLLVYASSRRGGLLISLDDAGSLGPSLTRCALA